MMTPDEPMNHVFRDLIEEHRDRYSVSYQPADARSSIAALNLFFSDAAAKDVPLVRKSMESEMERWLKRFPVPVKVSSYNSKKRLIRLSPTAGESHLSGYVRLFDSAVVRRWGVIEEAEIPSDAKDPAHLEDAYKELPFRVREEERAMERFAFRVRLKGLAFAILMVLIVPALTQAVVRWGQELALPLMLCSAAIGIYKGSGTLGWRKPSRWEKRKIDLICRKEHYFYHCEKNPTSFARLEQMNHRREVSEENKETKRLVERLAARRQRKRPRPSWVLLPRFLRLKRS